MYHHGKRQGQGAYSNQKLKYTGEWFQDVYHGMGRLEIFGQFIHRGNFHNGDFVAKKAVPPPFVTASKDLDSKYIQKRHNVMAELSKRNKVGTTVVSEGTATPRLQDGDTKDYKTIAPQKHAISANDLVGALNKQRPAPTVAPKQPPNRKKTVLDELSGALSKRHADMEAHVVSFSPKPTSKEPANISVKSNNMVTSNNVHPQITDIRRKENLMAELAKARKPITQNTPPRTDASVRPLPTKKNITIQNTMKGGGSTSVSSSSKGKRQTLMDELNSKLAEKNRSL